MVISISVYTAVGMNEDSVMIMKKNMYDLMKVQAVVSYTEAIDSSMLVEVTVGTQGKKE